FPFGLVRIAVAKSGPALASAGKRQQRWSTPTVFGSCALSLERGSLLWLPTNAEVEATKRRRPACRPTPCAQPSTADRAKREQPPHHSAEVRDFCPESPGGN